MNVHLSFGNKKTKTHYPNPYNENPEADTFTACGRLVVESTVVDTYGETPGAFVDDDGYALVFEGPGVSDTPTCKSCLRALAAFWRGPNKRNFFRSDRYYKDRSKTRADGNPWRESRPPFFDFSRQLPQKSNWRARVDTRPRHTGMGNRPRMSLTHLNAALKGDACDRAGLAEDDVQRNPEHRLRSQLHRHDRPPCHP